MSAHCLPEDCRGGPEGSLQGDGRCRRNPEARQTRRVHSKQVVTNLSIEDFPLRSGHLHCCMVSPRRLARNPKRRSNSLASQAKRRADGASFVVIAVFNRRPCCQCNLLTESLGRQLTATPFN